MAMIPIFNQHAGPLPLTATFKSPTDGGAIIYASGSLRSTKSPLLIGFQVLIDGHVVGTSQIWSNETNVHRATVPVIVTAPEDFKPHTLTLQAMNGDTVGDQNDYFTATLVF